MAACRAAGIKGPLGFANRFGRRLGDLSTAKAMQLLRGEVEPPTADFPNQFPLADVPPMTEDELAKHRRWWREHVLTGQGVGRVDDLDSEATQGRPVFGEREDTAYTNKKARAS